LTYQRVARVGEVPDGRGLCVRIDGIDVGLFRVDGEIHAMENRCPHQGDPLSEGVLEGGIVTCRAHLWQFDVRTGFRPEDADGFPIPCFAVRVADGCVEVDLEQPLNRPPRRGARG
jgi:nitrite reductase/ring-hydroxylating ferredoxin subunit